MRTGSFWKDRAILVELGASSLAGSEWYVRFGRRQLLTDWFRDHTREQTQEMLNSTVVFQGGIPLRILELFPIVEPKKLRVGRVYFPNDLQESDIEQLRSFLNEQAKREGLQIEPESVQLQVRVDEAVGIILAFTAIAR